MAATVALARHGTEIRQPVRRAWCDATPAGAGKILLEIVPTPILGQKLSAFRSRIELVFEVEAWNGSSGAVIPGQAVPQREVINVCDPQQPVSVGAALVTLERALDALNAADVASAPAAVQAQALRVLERAEAKHTAARARVLAAFTAQDGYEDDGQGSARMWLRWQTRVTKAASMGAVGWARRLAAHPAVAASLADGEISTSWARAVCQWSDRLPSDMRHDADQILAAAAAGGAELADLAGLAQQMFERSRMGRPDGDEDDGFEDRRLLLDVTFGGAGRLTGDLTPGCAAAVNAVLEALGKPAGPEDLRTVTQRRHDALEEACRRLIAAKMVPGRAGQPTQAQVHITLAQLRNLPGASEAEAAWRAAAACDATIAPVVTGHVDVAALDRLTEVFLTAHGQDGGQEGRACGCRCGGCTCPARTPLSAETLERLRGSLLAMAADVLSGPGGLAAWLRQSQLTGPAGGPGLPLDVPLPLDAGEAGPAIPAHLRRAATARHPHCAFPGCDQPTSVCQIHHLTPRSAGGLTALRNLVPLCAFHHLIVIHRWGWTLRLKPDGTTAATSPDGRRTYHSHGPPTPGQQDSPPSRAA
jgi:hypothetical protein